MIHIIAQAFAERVKALRITEHQGGHRHVCKQLHQDSGITRLLREARAEREKAAIERAAATKERHEQQKKLREEKKQAEYDVWLAQQKLPPTPR